MPKLLPLEFTFACPNEWLLDDDEPPIGIRMKVENGVIFFKPAQVEATNDVIDLHRLHPDWIAYMDGDHPMVERILRQLDWLGWLDGEFFALHPAQRGWQGISLKPSVDPLIGQPFVRVRQVEKVERRSREIRQRQRVIAAQERHRFRQRMLDARAAYR